MSKNNIDWLIAWNIILAICLLLALFVNNRNSSNFSEQLDERVSGVQSEIDNLDNISIQKTLDICTSKKDFSIAYYPDFSSRKVSYICLDNKTGNSYTLGDDYKWTHTTQTELK